MDNSPMPARGPSPGKVIFLTAIALGVPATVIWLAIPQTPPPCSTDISNEKAQALFDTALREDFKELRIEGPLKDSDIGTFQVKSVYRDDEDNWPTYFVMGEGTLKGAPRVIIAIGNGCGLGDLQDLGDGKNPITLPSLSSESFHS